jgi:hypothetical protein
MMKRINVYLDDDLWLSFRKHCLESRRSASKALTGLIEQCLAQPDTSFPGDASPPVARDRARHAAKASRKRLPSGV